MYYLGFNYFRIQAQNPFFWVLPSAPTIQQQKNSYDFDLNLKKEGSNEIFSNKFLNDIIELNIKVVTPDFTDLLAENQTSLWHYF